MEWRALEVDARWQAEMKDFFEDPAGRPADQQMTPLKKCFTSTRNASRRIGYTSGERTFLFVGPSPSDTDLKGASAISFWRHA